MDVVLVVVTKGCSVAVAVMTMTPPACCLFQLVWWAFQGIQLTDGEEVPKEVVTLREKVKGALAVIEERERRTKERSAMAKEDERLRKSAVPTPALALLLLPLLVLVVLIPLRRLCVTSCR